MDTLKIIKIGGNIIDDASALSQFLHQFAQLSGPKLLVHGGGKLATKLATTMQIPVQMHQGRRITDARTLDIITMVYAGKINKGIVAQLQSYTCNAIGFTGADGNTITSVKRPVTSIDYGFVGDIKRVDTHVVQQLIGNGITPVFCAITHDGKGQLFNTNADTIASELAIGFAKTHAVELYYCFEKNGVLRDINNSDSIIPNITTESYEALKEEGIITDGMLPKLSNCFHAIAHNVHKVYLGKPDMLFNKNMPYTTIQQ